MKKIALTYIMLFVSIDIFGTTVDTVSVLNFPVNFNFVTGQIKLTSHGLIALNNNQLISIGQEQNGITIPNTITHISDILSINNGYLIATDSDLLFFRKKIEKILSFDTGSIKLFPLSDKKFYLTHTTENVCYLYRGDVISKQLELIEQSSDEIKYIHSNDSCLITVTSSGIYLNKSNVRNNILTSWEPFSSAIYTSLGLIVGTDNMVCLVTDYETFMPLFNVGSKQLLFDGKFLYIFTKDNTLLQINLDIVGEIGQLTEYSKKIFELQIQNNKEKQDKSSKGYTLQLLNEGYSSNFAHMKFGTFPYHGLYGVISNSVVGMDMDRNEELEELALPDTISIDEFVFLRESSVFKDGEALFIMDKDLKLRKRGFDTESFSIEMQTDSTLLLYYGGSVFEYNPVADDLKRLICLGDEHIVDCAYSNNESFVVVTDDYVVMKKNGKLHPLAKLQERIVAADISPQGFFIGTVKGLYELTEYGELNQLLDQPISQILDDWEVTYFITQDGKIFRCGLSS